MSYQINAQLQPTHNAYSSVDTSYSKTDVHGSPHVLELDQSDTISPFLEKPGSTSQPSFFPHFERPSFSTRLKDAVNRYWVIELVAWLLSAISLGLLIVVLVYSDDRFIMYWPLSWKIASVIAFLNTCLKSTMMVGVVASLGQLKWLWFTNNRRLKDIETFDVASRGPFGALKFIWSIGFFHLSTLGAFIVLLTLALDTMTQQIVTTQIGQMYDSGSAWIPRSIGYESESLYTTGSVPGDQGPSADMVSAIFEGYFAASSISNMNDMAPPYWCPSGNCSYGSVQTLGVCYRCASITNEIQQSETDWYLPNGLSMNIANGILVANGSNALPSTSILTNVEPLMSYFSVMSQNVTSTPEPPTAAECAMYWCAIEYNSTMVNGKLNETVLNTWGNNTSPTVYGQETDIYIFPNRCPLNGTDAKVLSPDCTYHIDSLSHRGLQNFLPHFFSGRVSWHGQGWDIDTESAQALYTLANGDILITAEIVMSDLSRYMTRNIREWSPWNNNQFMTNSGHIIWSEPYYHVRWAWMVLPSSLVILSFILLIMTIVRSRGHEKWKSSALAMFYNGVEEEHRIDLGPGASITQMDEAAEKLHYKLVPKTHGSGHRLVGAVTHGTPYLTG